MSENMNIADVLIVGGGSAGAVLAARLSEDPSRRILLLEAGPAYEADAYPEALLDADMVADPGHDWGYTSRANATTTAPIFTPRGKVLGGSSSVNAGVAMRARSADFAKWADYGVSGWAFEDVLSTYKRLENTPTGDTAYHGRSGPVPLRQHTDLELSPSMRGFIEASVAQGFKRIDDFNGADQHGTGVDPMNVVDGVRQNTALVYLPAPVRSRPNLAIVGDVNVDRVLLDGKRSVGVLAADGTSYPAGEVILSGGSYGSASILLRSGIGPAADLRSLGIEVAADLPVGRRLHDHPFFFTAYALAPDYQQTSPAVQALLWTASSEAVGDELDLHITVGHPPAGFLFPTAAIVFAVAVVNPDSRGTLRLASPDPNDAPVIDNNLLGTERDARRLLEGVRLARAIARNAVFAPFTTGEVIPGDAVGDDALPEFVAR